MLSKLLAPIFMTLGILIGVHMGDVNTTSNSNAQKEVDFLSADFSGQIPDRGRGQEFAADIIVNFPFKIKSEVPKPPEILPVKFPVADKINPPDLKVKAGLSIDEKNNVYYEKNADEKTPIASLTKLLTALVVVDNLPADAEIVVSKNAVETEGEMGDLVVGEKLSAKNLLYIMLVDSSNDAAAALSEAIEQNGKNFTDLMNAKAKELKMANSLFSDPAGLNPDNISTANDLAKLANAALKNPLIRQIINTEETDIFSTDGKTAHHLKNTNKLINKISGIIGGKTGYTEEAGECLILMTEHQPSKTYFITIVLGAENGERFNEMEKLVSLTKKVYRW